MVSVENYEALEEYLPAYVENFGSKLANVLQMLSIIIGCYDTSAVFEIGCHDFNFLASAFDQDASPVKFPPALSEPLEPTINPTIPTSLSLDNVRGNIQHPTQRLSCK